MQNTEHNYKAEQPQKIEVANSPEREEISNWLATLEISTPYTHKVEDSPDDRWRICFAININQEEQHRKIMLYKKGDLAANFNGLTLELITENNKVLEPTAINTSDPCFLNVTFDQLRQEEYRNEKFRIKLIEE